MKRKVTIRLEAEIELDLEDFEDCSDEDELADAAKDEIEQTHFSFYIGDEEFDCMVVDVTMQKTEEEKDAE